jgi:hypothetical protein
MRGNVLYNKLISVTLAPTVVPAVTTSEQAFTVQGVQLNDWVEVSPPAQPAGISLHSARVTGANTVAITFINATAGGVTPATAAYYMYWMRPETLPLDNNVV